jgi:hypothetical protein
VVLREAEQVMSLKEILGEAEARALLNRSDGPMRMFPTLSPDEQNDILNGNCTYRQQEHQVILDYTRKWGDVS